ncbi:uncharacterized protein LOC117341040 isoform X1 [Pecten maximus]|uniref:uncharacterized protein LOC117341040 isoform X1 n=1 Tax=Pecten maximus TaxID=6579 RepID=UPI00145849FB|nr:uncharacterized protein LOC117341040 isoform X1 [Pecten maximus]
MVLHHNIDVIQSGTNSINQGGASLSTAPSGVDVSHTNTAYETSRPDNSQQLQQPALQPVSFIDSINKEMAELTAQNRIPSANHEKKIRVIVPKNNNEWDTIVPSVPNILASMGRPKLSFGFDPGNTVQQIKRIPINDLNNKVIPTDNVYKKSKQSNVQSILDMAFGTSNYVTSGKRREKTIAENTNSGKTEYESSKIDFVQYNTVDRRQAQSDPIKDVQEMYGVFSGALPNFGQSPFNVGLPGDQVYIPTLLMTQQQKLGSQPTEKNIVRDQLSGRLEASPMDTGRKQQDGKTISSQTVNQVIDRLPTRHQRENNKDSVLNANDRLTSNNEVNTGLQKHLGRRIQQDSAAVNSVGLSQPVKGTPQSVGVMTSSTVATTVAPAFPTRKLTTSHVILERLFDYNALVTTTPLPVTRNRDAVYTQMKNGPFVEGNKVTGALKDLTTTSVNQNNVIDNTKKISGPPKDGKEMTVPEKQNVRSTFNGNENVFTTRVTKTETINTLGNTKASNPESRSLVTFSNQHQPSFVSNSHNKIRNTAMPGWNADYSVANSLSGFGNLDLKVESAIKTKIPSSSTGISGEGKGAETINQKNVGSSVQPLTVTPIVVGTNGKSLIEKVVTGDTSLSSVSKNNAKTQAKSTETKGNEPATISLSNPSGGQIISGDSSSISLVSRNTLEYGLDKTAKDSQDQLKPTGKHGITANTQTVFSVPPRAGNGNINDQKTEKIEANVGKTSKFQNAGKNLNKFSSDKRNFLRHHGMNADFRDPGLHSLSIGSSFGDVRGESRKLPAKAKWPVNKKQNRKSSYKFSRVVKSGLRKNRPNRTPLPSSRLQHKKSYRTAGTIRRRHHYKTG